ncbi:hypothetical protein M406DRAFT_67701 [Cryphonectria parasitica EP155]|uniref:Uncharacterized protein n=1 Tax=Cryphonectria parasitica (strain ATCC 38755 / EP155) TaxID=660469 RepID=A0A9P4YDA3_CRYP1|nr:uncharacterized protein M406DRAFT_67701 [Cryphonectria parasitica EP155]KAF3771397.1 hypothetical protein M406DRAFT_67701 [Cryphonectria parasitica EP155]
MDPRTSEQKSFARRTDSLTRYTDKENATTSKLIRRRAFPTVALLGLLALMTSSSLGITISVLVTRFGLKTGPAGPESLAARILLFGASCMSVSYVILHVYASREEYVRSKGNPQINGYLAAAVAIVLLRLIVPVWVGAVALNVIVTAETGFDPVGGLKGNVVWIQLGICSAALLSTIVILAVIETTNQPFATSGFSKRTFIQGTGELRDGRSTFDLSVSRQGHREITENTKNVKFSDREGQDLERSFDRSRISTPESPDAEAQIAKEPFTNRPDKSQKWTMLRQDHLRIQLVPTPLDSVFASQDIPSELQVPSWRDEAYFAWRPPARAASIYARQDQRMSTRSSLSYHTFKQDESTETEERVSRTIEASTLDQRPLSYQRPLSRSLKSQQEPLVVPITPPAVPPETTEMQSTLALEVPLQSPKFAASPAPPSRADVLAQLSKRAAARRRNSLLMRQAHMLAQTSAEAIPVKFQDQDQTPTTQQSTSALAPASEVSLNAQVTDKGEKETQVSQVVPEDSNKDTAGLARNFSRPRVRPIDGDVRPVSSDTKKSGVDETSTQERMRGRARSATRRPTEGERERTIPLSLRPHSNGGRADGATTKIGIRHENDRPGSRNYQRPTARVQEPRRALLLPNSDVKLKGLGQGSNRRLHDRITMWRDGLQVQDQETGEQPGPSISDDGIS